MKVTENLIFQDTYWLSYISIVSFDLSNGSCSQHSYILLGRLKKYKWETVTIIHHIYSYCSDYKPERNSKKGLKHQDGIHGCE